MKRYFKFIISLIFILNLTNNVICNAIEVKDENTITIQSADRLQNIKQKGVITVVSPNQKPFSFKDPVTNIFSGIDAEILSEVAKRLGIEKVNVRYIPFPNVLEELINNSENDILGQGVFITDERKKIVNFTNPIYNNQDAILTRKESSINSKDDLKNAKIGLIGGSLYETLAKDWKQQGLLKEYMNFYDFNSLIIALENRIVDGILTDSMSAENSILMNPKSNFKILSPTQYKPEINYSIGYPLKKEDITLLNAINEKLLDMKNDGTIYEILTKYGLTKYYIS